MALRIGGQVLSGIIRAPHGGGGVILTKNQAGKPGFNYTEW